MATKKNAKKTRVSKQAKKSAFKFKWWMGVLIIGIVVVLGLVVIRFSRASEKYLSYDVTYVQGHRCLWYNGQANCQLLNDSVPFDFTNKFGTTVYCRAGQYNYITPGDGIKYFACLPK